MNTDFKTRCEILSDIWMTYREDEALEDFVKYNDLGLPLAFAIEENLVGLTERARELIDETFNMLMEALGLEDTGFKDMDEILEAESTDEDPYEIPINYIEEDDEDNSEEGVGYSGAEYRKGFDDGAKAEQERVQSIAQMHMKWAKQQNKGNEYMHWHNVSEILKPMNIDPNYDDEDF